MRAAVFCIAVTFVVVVQAEEFRWSFEASSEDQLVGEANLQAVGPTSRNFRGMPDENWALRLDGNGDYLRVPDNGPYGSLDFSQGDPISIEAWVRLDTIGSGHNVYVVGKGRTHKDGPRDNQNYALRLRAVGKQACLSFLFRSQADETGNSQWHRWTSKRGMRADGGWHHIAVTYRFGAPETIRGYVDGENVDGKWDMGGATSRPPMVDDDDLWIGSSHGGGPTTSLDGAIDEVVIARSIIPADQFSERRVVIIRPPEAPAGDVLPDRVMVSLFEDVGSHAAWPTVMPAPLTLYDQSAMAFARIPVPYGAGGVRRDWKGPAMLVATTEMDFPQGKVEWMLRAGGLSRLWIGDTLVAETPAHLGNTNGHGEVDPYPHDDPWVRPVRMGHHQAVTASEIDRGRHRVSLETMIGGDGFRYEAGEIIVAYRVDADQPWRVLSPTASFALTDTEWRSYAPIHHAEIQQVEDRQRRLASSGQDSYWQMRHDHAREIVASLPDIKLPTVPQDASLIDRLILRRLQTAGSDAEVTSRTSDAEFLRRLYLDCVGVVPSPAELDDFARLDGDSRQRRSQAIDRVLDDPRWADHWTAYWMDVLAENASMLKPSLNNSGPFRWYLYDMLRDNVPIDRWATGLLRMEGSLLFGGAAGFGMASDNDVPMAAKAHVVTSAFLGANMKCARCHDAPYHDWTQRDLFTLAAMLERKPIKVPASSSVPQAFFADQDEVASLITLSLAPGQEVQPSWSLASYTTEAPVDERMLTANDSRELLAYQITRVENRQFAKTIVNRVWNRLLGEGIVEPVDDWEGARPSHPVLLDYLARELARHDFDVKHVIRLILRSDAYQRQSVDRPVDLDADKRLFATPRARRMSAEQLVDSMHAVVGRAMDADELTFDPEARMKPTAQNNLGLPRRAWQMTSLSNERDRPALSLPRSAAVNECMEAFGWTGSRQEPINHRPSEPNVIQPGILASGLLSIQLTRLTDGDELTSMAIEADSIETFVEALFHRFLTRPPTDDEQRQFIAQLRPGFDQRVLKTPLPGETPIREPLVSWANHLHPVASEVRLREAARLRLGPQATRWIQPEWRERLEDVVWALINTPEFQFIP